MTRRHIWRAARIGGALLGAWLAGRALARHLRQIEREAQCW